MKTANIENSFREFWYKEEQKIMGSSWRKMWSLRRALSLFFFFFNKIGDISAYLYEMGMAQGGRRN